MLRSKDLQADLDVLERVYRSLHPGLNRYLTEAGVAALFADGRRAFGRDQSQGEAFFELTALTARLKCGHSYPNFFNQNKATQDALFRGPRLPFHFRWLDGEMVVSRNATTLANLARGTTIETLGGVAAQHILARMLPLARADGSNDSKRRAYLEVTGDSDFEAFDIFLPLLFPQVISPQGQVRVTARSPAGQRSTFTIDTQSQAERKKTLKTALTGHPPGAPLWELKMMQRNNSSFGYLAMPSWVAYQLTWDWRSALVSAMEQLSASGTPALIIDLRGNEGGSDIGDVIIAHLIEKPVTRRPTVRRVRFTTVPAELRPLLHTWDPTFFTLGAGPEVIDAGNGFRELMPDESFSATIAPAAPRYRGRVVVLVDAANSSATFQFAEMVQRNNLATLVGAPTGGSQRGINGGAFFFAKLPNTGLEVDVPLIGTFPAEAAEVPDRGIVPGVVVMVTAKDLAEGRDTQLERAIDEALR